MHNKHNRLTGRDGPERLSDTTDWDTSREPVEELAAEFAERVRNGDRVSIEEYAEQHPDIAPQIRELFPAVSAMERLNCKRVRNPSLGPTGPIIEQLGDYRIIGEIARGGMGVVYEAEQITLGRRVAVKVLPRHALRSPRDIQRFKREAQTAANLHHTNIVPVFGVGEQDGTHYIVMQLIQGVGLDEVFDELRRVIAGHGESPDAAGTRSSRRSSCIERSAATLLNDTLNRNSTTVADGIQRDHDKQLAVTTRNGSVQPKDSIPDVAQIRATVGTEYYRNVARIGSQAARALSYAHRHATLHRDVKPGNLILDDEGVVWMADFGLAKAVEHEDVTWTGDVVGTIGYMAPERFEGTATALSDVYSLGLTLYELLAFQRVYDGSDRVATMRRVTNESLPRIRKSNLDVPIDLETIVLKAVARNPSDRYESAEELGDDLECFLYDRPIRARRVGYAEQFFRWCRRNRAVASLAASVLVLLVTVLGVTMAGYLHATAQRRQVEATSRLAIRALDEIYGQLAPAQLRIPSPSLDEDTQNTSLDGTQAPLSREVALLLENLLIFYDDLSRQSGDVEAVATKSIVANRKVGDIRRRLGEFDRARVAYDDTIQRIETLGTGARASATIRLELARSQNGRGIVLQKLDASKEASQSHRRAIEQLDSSSDFPGERFELARSHYLLHLSERRSRKHKREGRHEPDAHLRQAIEILGELRAAQPEVAEYRVLLAHCYLATNSSCNSDGTLSKFQTQAIELLEDLHRTAPDVTDYQFELADAYLAIEWREHWRNRDRERPIGELAKSEFRLRRALDVSANLEIRHPDIPQYHVLKKSLHHNLGYALKGQQRLTEAMHHFEQAIQRQVDVVNKAHEPELQRVWLLHVQLNHAQVLRDLEKSAEARERLASIVAGFEELRQHPKISENRFYARLAEKYLAQSYATFAGVLNQLGEDEKADIVLRKAEKIES